MPVRGRTTIETYDAVATEYLENTRDFSPGLKWVSRFAEAVPDGSSVADLGSGPGRDTARLRSHGINAFCLDLSFGMLDAGRFEYPASRVQGSLMSLPIRGSSIAGAWANASLLHLAPTEFRLALCEIHRVLIPSGHLHISVKRGEGSEWESSRYGRPRWFQYWSGAEFDRELNRAALVPVFSSEERSPSATWLVRLCRAV